METLGRYELLARIGQGGMAEVFRARLVAAPGFARPCAIKRVRRDLVGDKGIRRLFLDEARLCAGLVHPHVVQVLDLGEHELAPFIAMELVDGPSLAWLARHAIARGAPLSLPVCAFIVARVAEGLHYAHEHGGLRIVHRDVSPQNVLLSRYGDVKLGDFGVAKARSQLATTRPGMIKGKLAYMAPEQLTGAAVDRRSDLFALGVVLWELVARARLFVGGEPYLLMKRIAQEPVAQASSVNAAVPAALDDVIGACLEKDAGRRPGTALAVQRALDAWRAEVAPGDGRTALCEELAALGVDGLPGGSPGALAGGDLTDDDGTAVDAAVSPAPVTLPPWK